jgi:hypothetical protein
MVSAFSSRMFIDNRPRDPEFDEQGNKLLVKQLELTPITFIDPGFVFDFIYR